MIKKGESMAKKKYLVFAGIMLPLMGNFGFYWYTQEGGGQEIYEQGRITPITTTELKKTLKQNDSIILINALAPEVYKDCHIKAKGSINFPFDLEGAALDTWEKNLLNKYPNAKHQPIYVYSASQTCTASETASKRLRALGFKKIFEYKGGMREWRDTVGKESCEGPCTKEYLSKKLD